MDRWCGTAYTLALNKKIIKGDGNGSNHYAFSIIFIIKGQNGTKILIHPFSQRHAPSLCDLLMKVCCTKPSIWGTEYKASRTCNIWCRQRMIEKDSTCAGMKSDSKYKQCKCNVVTYAMFKSLMGEVDREKVGTDHINAFRSYFNSNPNSLLSRATKRNA